MKNISYWIGTLSLSILMIGMVSQTPAHAGQSQYRSQYITWEDVRRDQRRLQVLEDRRDEARRQRDWSEVRDLNRRINALQARIDSEREYIRNHRR